MYIYAHAANIMNDINDIGDSAEIKQEKIDCSDEADIESNNQLDILVRKVIEYSFGSYIGDGNLIMDKNYSIYHKGNQELIIESKCVDDTPVKDVLKNFIIETQRNRINMVTSKQECYNITNMIVATQEEVC